MDPDHGDERTIEIARFAVGGSVHLSYDDLFRHALVVGATGTGKSVLLERAFAQLALDPEIGVMLIDLHGDLAERALTLIPRSRSNQVAYVNAADLEHMVGLDVSEDVTQPELRAVGVDGILSGMKSLWADFFGPRMEEVLRNALEIILETPGLTILALPRLLTDAEFRGRVLARSRSPMPRVYFEQRFNVLREQDRQEWIAPVLNKVTSFFATPATRLMLGGRATLHIDQLTDRGRIALCNLSQAALGKRSAALVAALILARVLSATLSRARLPEERRRPFFVLADELQLYAHPLVPLLSEGRKYRVGLLGATQSLMPPLLEEVRHALVANVGTIGAFRVGSEDAHLLAREFGVDERALMEQSFGKLVMRPAWVPQAFPCEACERPQPLHDGEGIKQQSRRHYGRRRERIEAKVLEELGIA